MDEHGRPGQAAHQGPGADGRGALTMSLHLGFTDAAAITVAVGLVLMVVQPKGLRSIALHPTTPARIARAIVVSLRCLGQAVALSTFGALLAVVADAAVVAQR